MKAELPEKANEALKSAIRQALTGSLSLSTYGKTCNS